MNDMTKRRHSRYIGFLMMAMLLIGGMVNDAWAYKVTYHILTLPIDNSIYHLDAEFSGKRLEAVRVIDNKATSSTKVGLPAQYKSPLAKNFRYYLSGVNVTKSPSAYPMYAYNTKNKSYHYTIVDEANFIDIASYTISEDIEVYVTYEYDADNTIYKLDGTKDYNLSMSGGFLAFNRGRNNRLAIIPENSGRVSAEALASDDFVKIDVKGIPGTNISDYWKDNKTPKDAVAGQFFFKFQFVGEDPYNFLIRTAYKKNYTYREQHGSETSLLNKYYKDSYLFWPSSENSGFFLASDDHRQYTQTSTAYIPDEVDDIPSTPITGYFKSKGVDLVYNSFALLYNTKENGYVFMISRYVDGNGNIGTKDDYRTAKYNFLGRDDNYNNLKSISKTLADASESYSTDERTYNVYKYVFKVTKKISGTVLSIPIQVSEYYTESSPLDFVPEALKRKYVTFTGAYKENTFDNSFASFADVDANATTEDIGGKLHKVIWLQYETNLPFETWTDLDADGIVDFDELKWYNFHVNKNENYSASWDGTQIKTSAGSSKYARASHFAFVGDPYDLTIVGRKASEDGSDNPSTLNYMKLADPVTGNVSFDLVASATTWGILYDDNKDDYKDCFRLKDNSGDNYLSRNSTTGNPLIGTTTSDEAVRITVAPLPTKPFVYYIMRLDGSIALMATGNHEPSAKLGFNTIPEIIRSPFINGRTLSFYGSYTEVQGGATKAKSDATAQTPTIAYAKDIEDNTVQYIVARYDFPSAGNPYYTYINGSVSFNVRLNGEYIYYEDGTIKSKASPTDVELETTPYLWTLGGADPYAMTIRNESVNKYVTAGATDKSDLGWDESNATKFVVKGGTSQSVYEVMYATGDGVDASTTYYNIGRDGTGTKIFQNTTYAHGYDQLRFQLTARNAHRVTYHLIDKSNKELLQVVARHSPTESPLFPNDYSSPMVSQYHYWVLSNFDRDGDIYSLKASQTELSTVGSETDIYVTYDTGNGYDLQSKRTMYLLEYDMGESFYQEDGADGLTTETQKAVYPYCNGDGNFFVYGREQYDIQQQTAASTRTRWAWFLESLNNDPYHVMICSRQIETYSGYDNRAYFRTYAETFGDGTTHVVTNLSWPGISGEQGTEYMMLGSIGQFRLVTTASVDDGSTNVRRVVNSFEQYWKTWNTIRLKVLGDKNAVARQSDPNIVPESPAAPTAAEAGVGNRTYLTDNMGWHSYEQWAYAIRWNDYNKAGDKNKKGWEDLEHWFQTISMGEGYFNLVPVKIDPVLILLDKHGWEIMRKPLPSDPTDPDKDAKYDVIRPYDSPMIKEYHFWGSAKKRSGYHQYYDLSGRMKVDGKDYTSTSLTKLPDYYNSDGTSNTTIIDAKGNLLDQYVTYVVKDEYVENYTSDTKTGQPFMIQQGNHFVYNNSNAIGTIDVPATGAMSQYIIENISTLIPSGSKNTELWYMKPNPDIDQEMGYDVPGNPAHSWTTAEGYAGYTGEFDDGFDPYNIQISSVSTPANYFVTDATTAQIEEGSIVGNGTANTLGAQKEVRVALTGGMDNRTIQMTNATFMAVRDRDGNMQLMPRFDHSKRLKDFSELVNPDDGEVTKTYTKLYRPKVYTYKILDNTGNESLRYQSGGDLIPQTPAHFKSPLAKDFVYCANSTLTDTITGSLDGATLTDNTVYVRYSYNDEADELNMLKGRWLTMQLNNYDMYYDNGIYDDISSSKPATIDADAKKWQWKFLATPFSEPDPYAVPLYNRSKTDGEAINAKGAILSHTSGGYALIKAGTQDMDYLFLKSNENTSLANTWGAESGFQSTSCAFDGTKSQIKLINEVSRRFNYRIYTNGGVLAVSADQDNTIEDNTPTLPDEIKSPLLNTDQFRYYEALTDTAANSGKALQYLYGLYDDIVYVRYNAYDLKETEYKVPNVRNDKSEDPVAKGEGSNDASLDINGELIYNIIWYADNMMQSTDGSAISGLADQDLQGGNAFVWQFEGNDPYAIKIKHKNSEKYAVGTSTMAATATSTFMLLPSSDEWEYGILQKTGTNDKLTTVGNATTTEDPTKFIIFGLSTHKVIYHLIIANIGVKAKIPYSKDNNPRDPRYDQDEGKLVIDGTSWRDLTTATSGVTGDKYQLGETKSINGNNVTYCVDDGHITLGDPLKVPDALKRPNCKYFFYVDGIYNNEACTSPHESLNTLYQGMRITEMGTEPDLLGKTVVINIEYEFDDGLTETNTGNHFVTNSNGTEWYTFETSDETPYLARYTYYSAKVSNVEGRAGHYTNEYLWSPVGDPYGFKMYNRYVYKNGGETTKVMTTESTPAADADLIMKEDATNNPVYELLAGNHEGDFKVQTLTVPGSGTPLYLDNHNGVMKLKTSTTTEWHFGLDQTLFDPFYFGAGNVGGLTTTVKAGTGKEKSGKELYEEATNIMEKQAVVYDPDNIVDFTPGYYRIFNQPNSLGITTPRYLSGYTHKTELTPGTGTELAPVSIPMHFYEREGVTTSFDILGSGFTVTAATQGQIPIEAPEYDPASIFYITGTATTAKMSTQGLYVKENKMTETSGEATTFHVVDMGGAVVLIHDGNATPADRKYLHYKQSENIYDVKFNTGSEINDDDAAKWCMEPANKKGLWIETHSGGEEETLTNLWYYATICVPFDMLISNKNEDPDHSSNAYTCVPAESPWTGGMLHPKPMGNYNVAPYENNDYFVPAGTPVLFSTRRATSHIKATIPTATPSTPITTIFSYEYLEQLLTPYDDNRRVYVFGPKMEGTITLNNTTGAVTAVLPSLGNTNVGFHINANLNKESALTWSSWTRNNYYVLHNKIYYRAPAVALTPAPGRTGPEFVPVLFGDEEQPGMQKEQEGKTGDGCVYDLLGRKVATAQQAADGTWRHRLGPGVYIIDGKKVVCSN